MLSHLSMDLCNLILEFSGYHKLRKGKYICQINLENDIINLLVNIPKIYNSRVFLPISTCRMRGGFMDKMIKIESHTENDDYLSNNYYMYYSCGYFDDDLYEIENIDFKVLNY